MLRCRVILSVFMFVSAVVSINACGDVVTDPRASQDGGTNNSDTGTALQDSGTLPIDPIDPFCSTCGGDSCIDLKSSNQHCGSCNSPCGGGASCMSGSCQCATGYTTCETSCALLSVDSHNCGSCGNACEAGLSCIGGICQTSPPGEACSTRLLLAAVGEWEFDLTGYALIDTPACIDTQNPDFYVRIEGSTSARKIYVSDGFDMVLFQGDTLCSTGTCKKDPDSVTEGFHLCSTNKKYSIRISRSASNTDNNRVTFRSDAVTDAAGCIQK
ncbi:MAG: hypothetical protein IPJ88_08625 [Myxococcales bacterium]|nr:MAG: hypothetical protein IPJ88_08625 [Myxococcales bacterium]